MTASEYKRYAENEKLNWCCGRTDCCKPNPESLLQEILNKLDTLATKSDLDVLASKITKISTDVADINDALSKMEPRLSAVEEDLTLVKNDLKSLHDSKADSLGMESVIEEIADRGRRSRNIILYDIPENKSKTLTVRVKHDNDLVLKLIESFCTPGRDNSFKSSRLGRIQGNRPRPLKIIFNSSDITVDFSKNFDSSVLSRIDDKLTGVSFSRDRTPSERKHLAELKSSLKRRIESGESDLTIKYMNGVPKIIKKASKND